MGLVPVESGDIRLAGAALPRRGGRALKAWRHQVGMTFQDPTGSLSPRLTVRALITEPFRIHGLTRRELGAEARRLVSLVGLAEDFLDRYPHELSGGQARRVGIARALALDPRLLIADEPTAGLDVSVQGEVLNLLARLRQELGIALLLITHNLAAVRLSAERLGVMYMGRRILIRPHSSRRFRSPIRPATGSARSPARCRACSAARPAASSTRAAPMPSRAAARKRPPHGRSHPAMSRAATFR
jgi:ABC-type glutathione transport system ATPase component